MDDTIRLFIHNVQCFLEHVGGIMPVWDAELATKSVLESAPLRALSESVNDLQVFLYHSLHSHSLQNL